MAFYVIAGKPDCPNFAHVCYVCMYLKNNLPNFKYRSIQLLEGDWEHWLVDKNHTNGWHHTKSPIIWKELSKLGGKAYLIGGISEFWEYCYDYYGLQSLLSKEELEKLVQDNLQYAKEQEKKAKEKKYISVTGASNELTNILLLELFKLDELKNTEFSLRLFDENVDPYADLDVVLFILDSISDFHNDITIVDTFPQALENCDLLIITDDFSQRADEDREDWLMRNVYNMHVLAEDLNKHAKRTLKVVFAGYGPICFNASILIDHCTKIRLTNIIVITADIGLCPLKVISEETKIPLHELNAPPVWGFTGLKNFIDIGSIIKKCDVHRPYSRALKTNGSTLPLGEIVTELRYIDYLIHDIKDVIWDKVDSIREGIKEHLNRPPIYSKVRATIKVLEIWLSEKPSDEIISLGVISNGSFGIPTGIVASQPTIFNGKYWEPFSKFPINEFSQSQLATLWANILKIMHTFSQLKQRKRSTYFI